jgi:hypothetical protein
MKDLKKKILNLEKRPLEFQIEIYKRRAISNALKMGYDVEKLAVMFDKTKEDILEFEEGYERWKWLKKVKELVLIWNKEIGNDRKLERKRKKNSQ